MGLGTGDVVVGLAEELLLELVELDAADEDVSNELSDVVDELDEEGAAAAEEDEVDEELEGGETDDELELDELLGTTEDDDELLLDAGTVEELAAERRVSTAR